jgi:protein SCO1
LKKIKLLIIISLFCFFGILTYTLWPKGSEFPVLKQLESFSMMTITNGSYNFDNEKLKVVAFVYTNCPDICPLTMLDFKKFQMKLKENGNFSKDVHLITITFDPKRDDKDTLINYAKAFNADFSGWIWLRDTEKKTEEVTSIFQLKYKQTNSGYFSHQTSIYLVDRKNRIRSIYRMATPNEPTNIEAIMKDIKILIKE